MPDGTANLDHLPVDPVLLKGIVRELLACSFSVDAPSPFARATVRPVSVEPVGDLLARQVAAGVELRLCQSLVLLGRAILSSSLHWSLIRMRNAQGWE